MEYISIHTLCCMITTQQHNMGSLWGSRCQIARHKPTPVGWFAHLPEQNVLVVASQSVKYISLEALLYPYPVLMYGISANVSQLLIAELLVKCHNTV